MERAAVLGELDPAAIDAALTPRRRGAPTLRRILEPWRDVAGGPVGPRLRSELEARVLALIAAAKLPAPRCNQRVRAGGRRLEVDLLWPGERLVVEIDGWAFHRGATAFDRDRRRDRDLALAGYRSLRFTSAHIDREPAAVVAAIQRLLGEAAQRHPVGRSRRSRPTPVR